MRILSQKNFYKEKIVHERFLVYLVINCSISFDICRAWQESWIGVIFQDNIYRIIIVRGHVQG